MSKLAIHIGGGDASALLARLQPPAGRGERIDRPGFSIAADGAVRVLRTGSCTLLVSGTPLPEPAACPADWREAAGVFAERDGIHLLVLLDEAAGRLVIATDFLGLQPLYWSHGPDGLRLCSDTKAFPAAAPDPAGWGGFLALGTTLGDRTLTDGVTRVPAASVVVVDLATAAVVETRRWWRLERPARDASAADIAAAFDDSMDRAVAAARHPHTLLLSGGFDARLMACALTRRGVPVEAVVVSHADENFDADGRYAQAMARRLGIPCRFARPDPDFFSSPAFLDYLFASDGEVPGMGLFITQVGQFVPPDRTVWDGLLPDKALKPAADGPGGFAAFVAAKVRPWGAPVWEAACAVFGRDLARAMWDGFQDDLRAEIGQDRDDAAGVAAFVLRNRGRNRIAPNPFKVFQRAAQPLTPGMTRAFIEATLPLPAERKAGGQLYFDLFRAVMPEALSVPIASGDTLVRPHALSVDYYLWANLIRAGRFVRRRPRLMRLMGLKGRLPAFRRSAWLDAPALWDNPDPLLAGPAIAALRAGRTVSPAAQQVLFYWQTWRWLHRGELRDKLGVAPAAELEAAAV